MKEKGLLLLSGGFDSGVAGKILLDQGVPLEAIHYSLEPFVDDAPEKKCRVLCRQLGIASLHVHRIGPALQHIAKTADHGHYFVLMKRLMLRVASQVAIHRNCSFLVTGESLGQVSSQTLSNLSVISRAASLPVIRPLLAVDKQEIIDLAKRFKLHDISVGKETCDVLGPAHPVTRSDAATVEQLEQKAGFPRLVAEVLSSGKPATADN